MATPTKTVPYTLYLPENIASETSGIPIANKAEVQIGGLVFTGKNRIEYGQYRNQNFLSLLANFSSPEGTTPGEPDSDVISSPLVGQTWYNQTDGALYIYTGSWVTLASTIALNADAITVSPTVNGQSNVQASLTDLNTRTNTNATNLSDHINANPAHAAANINVSPVVSGGSNVQTALQGLETAIGAITASDVDFAPYISIGSTNVQAAIQELKDELDAVSGAGVTASAVSVSPTVNGQSNVQASLTDLNTRTNTNATNLSNHISASPAHAAANINVSPVVSGGNNVQTALQGLEAAIGAGSGVSETGTSSGFTPNAGTTLTRSNPLASAPDIMQVVLVCQVPELGFLAGDIVVLNPQGVDFDEGSGPGKTGNLLAYRLSTNQIRVSLQYHKSQIAIAPYSGVGYNNLQQITPANWQGFVKTIRF